ncbi:AAA family ATPase [bacterium]|nr:AAA family ATPase [bacterium]
MTNTIIILESNKTFLKQIRKLLEAETYTVITCESALDAYKVAIKQQVDLIVTNVQLPKVSGLHLAKKLKSKAITDKVPLLFFGKKTILDAQVKERIASLGHNFLALPLNKSKLIEMIGHILHHEPVDDDDQNTEVKFQDDSGIEHDASQVDTDKFDQKEIKEGLDKSGEYREDYEASKVLAEITQQAEENLSSIIAAKEKSQLTPTSPGTTNYLGWWGFKIRPYSNTPDSRFYYNSKQHSEAITRLMHAVENMEGLAVLIGRIGSGKTTLARRMLESFDPSEYVVALMVIIHSAITPDWLLRKIALQLGVKKTETQKLLLIGQLYQRLVEIYEEGKKAVILIDEAQMLQTRELMEEFRGLLNLEVPGKKLLTFVFFGLEELNDYLALDEPLKQRIALKYTLHSFDRPSTRSYILHRLHVAGVTNPIFSEDAISLVYELAKGTPRLINTICNNALLEGFFLKKRYIDQNLIRSVGENLDLEEHA